MAVTKTTYTQAGSTTQYAVPFQVIASADIDVYVDGVLQLQQNTTSTADVTHPQVISGDIVVGTPLINYVVAANNATITFNAAPTVGDFIVVERTTDDTLLETFVPGSTIRAADLNSAFERVLFISQEGVEIAEEAIGLSQEEDGTYDALGNRISNVGNATDDDDAVNRLQLGRVITDDLIEGEGIDLTDVTGGTNSNKQVTISAELSTAINPGVVQVNATTPIIASYANPGELELSIAADSIDLDRIKNSDIITSSETWTPSNDTIATTQAIEDQIDQAITSNIGTDGTGITVTDDGDGTITLGLDADSIDLDRIKNSDIITEAEQDSGTTETDNNIFTALAAARRFDTLVQISNPGTATNWEVGKTWLQNDDDLTLSIWNGTGWTAVSSGGAFREQTNVVYVDPTGDDASTGHRISAPKETIKAAIDQINDEIDIELTSGGSGYVEGVYLSVPLTGGTGTGLTADITVNAAGAVTAVTLNSRTPLVNTYYIGDVLSASNTNLGGTGSGLQITVNGDGDGQIVVVAAGVYQEVAPIQIKRRNVSIIGQALRSCLVHPTVATENNNLFELNSGSYLSSLTFTGVKAGSGTGNSVDAALPVIQGWNAAFYDNAYITKSPYIQNCTNFSDSQINNSDLNAHNPAGGSAGDLTSAPTGGGLLVNGATPHDDSPLRSMVCDSYTHVALNGPGILVTNNGYAQCTSSYAFFNKYHIKALNGGQANLAASTTDFGDEALVANGKSSSAIFTSNVDGAAADLDTTFNINQPTAAASWFGSATRPQGNMLVTVNGITYPVLSAVAHTDSEGGAGWTVTISRPNVNNRSENLGLDGAVADDAAVQFFLRSQIASSGHTMEYVGSGTNYSALPENGGVPDDSKQIVESNGGKVWTAITDHNGKFSVGDFFEVDQRTGFVTITAGSYSFDVVSDATPQLGGELDAQNNKIVNLTDPTAAQDAATKNYVDTAIGGISTDLVSDLTPQLGGNLDVNDFSIVSKNGTGNIIVDPGTGSILLDGPIDNTGSGDIQISGSGGGNLEINRPITAPTNIDIRLNPQGTGVVAVTGAASLDDQAELRFEEDVLNGNNYVALKAPASVLSNVTWTLPDADGTTGQNLTTDGSGTLSWTSPSNPALIIDGDSKVQVNDNTPSASYIATQVDGVEVTYTTFDGIELLDQKDLKFYEDNANGTNYLAFKAPATVAANVTWTLPDSDAAVSGYALVSDGSGTLSWAAAGGGGGFDISTTPPVSPTAGDTYWDSDEGNAYIYYNDGVDSQWVPLVPSTPPKNATGGGTDEVFFENGQSVTTSYSISSGKNAMSAGPITINSGVTVTVPSGQSWVIV